MFGGDALRLCNAWHHFTGTRYKTPTPTSIESLTLIHMLLSMTRLFDPGSLIRCGIALAVWRFGPELESVSITTCKLEFITTIWSPGQHVVQIWKSGREQTSQKQRIKRTLAAL